MMEDGRTIPKRQERQSKKKTEDSKDHYHACYTSDIEPDNLVPQIINVGRGRYDKKDSCNDDDNCRLIGPLNESIEMTPHPCTNIEKQEETPQDNTQEAKRINSPRLNTNSRILDRAIISSINERCDCNC